MVGEALLECVTRATNVFPCSCVGGVVSVGVSVTARAVVGTGVTGVNVVKGDDDVGAVTTGVSNDAIVMVIVVDGGAVTGVIDIIGNGSAAVSIRNTAITTVDIVTVVILMKLLLGVLFVLLLMLLLVLSTLLL